MTAVACRALTGVQNQSIHQSRSTAEKVNTIKHYGSTTSNVVTIMK